MHRPELSVFDKVDGVASAVSQHPASDVVGGLGRHLHHPHRIPQVAEINPTRFSAGPPTPPKMPPTSPRLCPTRPRR